MVWGLLVVAGFCEILGVTSLKIFTDYKKKWALIGAITFWTIAFILLTLVFREIPVAVAYAIWTGIGGAGSTIVAAMFFKEKMGMLKIFFLSVTIIGVIGLRVFSS